LLAICAYAVWQSKPSVSHWEPAKPINDGDPAYSEKLATRRITPLTRLHWIALAFVPSSLMLGVTTHITLDIAAIPLLWVIPLAIYLLSFIIVFAWWPRLVHRGVVFIMPLVVLFLIYVTLTEPKMAIELRIGLHLLTLFF